MIALLNRIRDIKDGPCLTIVLNTHRTKPDSLKDAISLKNLVKEAETRLTEEFDRPVYEPIIEKLNLLVAEIDHNYNLEGMVLFVSGELAEMVRLPLEVKDRVVIGDRFSTRDLVRAMNQDAAYYVLVFSRRGARLIEAFNDRVVREIFNDVFPMPNPIIETDPLILTMPQGQDNIMENWFIQVDKAMMDVINAYPLPVVLACEKSNYDHFMKVAKKKDRIIGHINRTRTQEEARDIVEDAWKSVSGFLKMKNAARIDELKKAVSTGNFFTDFNDIWRAIGEGRGQTLFVKKGLIKPAIVRNGEIRLLDEPVPADEELVEDVVDLMIARNLAKGGDTVFVEGDELVEFQNLAMTARY